MACTARLASILPPSQRWFPEFDDLVAIYEFATGRFFDSSVDLSAYTRQDVNFDVIIFKFHYFPFLFRGGLAVTFEEHVRIDLGGLWVNGNRIGVAIGVGGYPDLLFRDLRR